MDDCKKSGATLKGGLHEGCCCHILLPLEIAYELELIAQSE